MVTMRSIFTPEVCHQTRVLIGLMLEKLAAAGK